MQVDPILETRDLRKSFGSGTARTPILDGISFSVREGDFVAVVGPSGCGKTTLLMALAGLVPGDAGEVRSAAIRCWHRRTGWP